MNKNMITEACPAETLKEYLRGLIRIQKEYLKRNMTIPKDLEIPGEVYITSESLKHLINSDAIDFLGSGHIDSEMQFFCKETPQFPSLEIRVLRLEDGRNVISYIKETARDNEPGVVWSRNNNTGTLLLYKRTDDLEEILSIQK